MGRMIAFLAVAVTGALALLIYLRMIQIYLVLRFKGVRAIAQVTDFKIEQAKDAEGKETGRIQRQPIFSFDAGGRYVSGIPAYSTGSPPPYRLGDSLDITYHAAKPQLFVASKDMGGKRIWLGFFLMLLFFGGILFLFVKFWDAPQIEEEFLTLLLRAARNMLFPHSGI